MIMRERYYDQNQNQWQDGISRSIAMLRFYSKVQNSLYY